MPKTILIIGAFDTKGPEYAFLREQIVAQGHDVLTMNTGVLGTTDLFPVDIEAGEVAQAGRSPMRLLAIYAPPGPEAELRQMDGVTIEPPKRGG